MKNEIARREIESLDYYLQNHTDDYSEESHTAMMMAIKALEQEPKWIPVSERLPEIGDCVLCSIASNYSKHKVVISHYNCEDFWSNGIIEAWMPLPKPYEPQESEG